MANEYTPPRNLKSIVDELRSADISEDCISIESKSLLQHGVCAHQYQPETPHAVVVYARSTEDVVTVVHVANKYKMPVVPYSGGTSLEGQYTGHSSGSLCVDLSRMDAIIAVHEADSDMVCQAGCRWQNINAFLEEKGIPLFFPLDPGMGASLGGMMATGCSGTNAVRYGTARGEWFINATVVLPSGEVIKTRSRSRKCAAGFDLTHLFIGAEGTLGIVTEVTIRLAPKMNTTVAAVQFPDVQRATQAATEMLQSGVPIQCVELMDSLTMHAINKYGKSTREWAEKDSLFIKLQGSRALIEEGAMMAERIAEKYDGTGFEHVLGDAEGESIWSDRKNAYFAGLNLLPGAKALTTDVCVPISNLPRLIDETKLDFVANGLLGPITGHVGDGNFHALLLFYPDELPKVREAVGRLVKRAIALDGTCTGEHGIGTSKQQYLCDELGNGTVELMKAIKRTIDPHNIFNPGKLYPVDSQTV